MVLTRRRRSNHHRLELHTVAPAVSADALLLQHLLHRAAWSACRLWPKRAATRAQVDGVCGSSAATPVDGRGGAQPDISSSTAARSRPKLERADLARPAGGCGMEATAVSIGKAVLSGVLGYAKSKAAEDVALKLGVEDDVSFITDELEMMQAFLMTADEERAKTKVLTTWVDQVRDVAYNVEDNLVDFEIHAEREKPHFLGCIPRNLSDRRRIAMEVKKLKARVEDISNRNLRYRLIKDGVGSSKPAAVTVDPGGNAGATASMFGIAGEAAELENPKMELGQLIITEELDLRVIAVWGTNGDLGKISEIRNAYDDLNIKAKFGCRAWVRIVHPFDPKAFLQSIVRQFYASCSQEPEISEAQDGKTVGTNVLLKMDKLTQIDLVHWYDAQVSSKRYLIVIDGLSMIDEWDYIKTYFPDKKNGSRIIVATQQVEIASLCPEQPHQVSKLKQLSADQVEESEMDSTKRISLSTAVTTVGSSVMSTNEIVTQEEGGPMVVTGSVVLSTTSTETKLYRSNTLVISEEVVVGRSTEKENVIHLVGQPNDTCSFKVISVWGMGGIGKTTLVRSVYRSQQLGGWNHAWATVLHPFNRDALLRNLCLQLQADIQEDPTTGGDTQKKKNVGTMGFDDMTLELSRLLDKKNFLIVLDDISSSQEWDSIKDYLAKARRVMLTMRDKNVANHCSGDDSNIYCLNGLEDADAFDLFKRKVFKDTTSFDLHHSMADQAKLILKKCGGLPLAISTIGSYLANKPKTTIEWRKLNDGLSVELEINPDLKMIKAILMRSYDGLPYQLKSSFLYLSIFPEDHVIQRKHVLRRWIAEGYSREMQYMAADQVGDWHFDELLDRSMILPMEARSPGSMNSYQLHDLIREICVSKAREENFVFILEEGCSLGGAQGAIRHLAIRSNWKRDKEVLQRMLDLSHVRSLTVFGEWRSFFISNRMRFLRVLDLEHTIGLRDHHLDQIGELLHLRFLSLRGCRSIFELPSSLANLRQLQTLDVRGTRICILPAAVTKLQKLKYLHASPELQFHEVDDIFDQYSDMRLDVLVDHKKQLKAWEERCCGYRPQWAVLCLPTAHVFWRPQLLEARLGRSGPYLLEDGVSRQDFCNLHRYMIKYDKDEIKLCGVKVPRGISKLKALHTLCDVNVAWGNSTFQGLRELTQLRKLSVAGVSAENNDKFWLAISGHSQLQSLSINYGKKYRAYFDLELLDGCLGGNVWPPKSLESLKMCGKIVMVTEWIHWLQNLSKLQLQKTRLNQDALKAIGKLPNLSVLRLNYASILGHRLRIPGPSFPSLLVLGLNDCLSSVEFEQEAMPKLEVLHAAWRCWHLEEVLGLHFLTSLKEIWLENGAVKKLVQRKLEKYTNNVTLKML
ncbi:hypothetical protein ACP4OV_010245 [Aristida adscensionis]